MDQTTPPSVPQEKTSQLAVWSLTLGILSLTCCSIISAVPGVICGHTAISRINSSNGGLGGKGLAIAGLITGYLGILFAVVWVPMMIAIAVPNFVKARSVAMQNVCINNLREIQAAKNEWALEKSKDQGDVPVANDLTPYLPNNKFPVCPAGGHYVIGAVSNSPTCSVPGHVLPQ